MHLLYATSDSCIQTRMFIERDREIEMERDRGDEPGIGNKSSGCTGYSLCHGNEGLLYLGIDLGVSSEREEVPSMGTHLPRCTQQLGPVLREREREFTYSVMYHTMCTMNVWHSLKMVAVLDTKTLEFSLL